MPAGLDGLDPVSLLCQMVADAAQDTQLSDLHSRLALSMARSAAIPYGQILTNDEMESLINDLFSCSNVNYTPDGKAVLSILPQTDIEHLLG
jgi:DNA mismatch repair protein MutL